jgi:hypothetical protein
MAGTLPNLPMSTQFDKSTGKPLKGGKLYFYAANTDTPQNGFQDSGLTITHPNPITLDGAGRVPSFYLADGSIHVRLTNKAGTIQFDERNLLVIGPSSGGGGGGGVDATTVFQTGDVMWLDTSAARTGWVRDNGRTIGSASSGATERANSDCQALFTFLWQNFADTLCPVLGGRGANAAADWAGDKQITLPDKRGYVPGGLPDMGNTDSARINNVPVSVGNLVTPGSRIGEALHTSTIGETPAHTHTGTTSDNPVNGGISNPIYNSGSAIAAFSTGGAQTSIPFSTHHHTFTTDSTGGNAAHNTTQLTVLGTFYRKL